MLAIHGVWSGGRLSLWAEDSARPRELPGPPPARPSRTARPHPFAATAGTLADVLAEFGEQTADLARKAAETELTLWLPARPGGPLSSPDCIPADPAAAGSPARRSAQAPCGKAAQSNRSGSFRSGTITRSILG